MSDVPASGPQKFEWVLSVEDQPDAFERYRASISNLYQVTGVSNHDIANFRNRAVGVHLGTSVMVRCWSLGQTFVRTAEEVRRSGYDHFNLLIDISGDITADYDGRAVNSGPGNVRFMDTSRELRTSLSAFEMINFVVPREKMPARLRNMDLHGLTLDASLGATRLLHRHVLGLFDDAEFLTPAQAAAGLDATLALVEGALGSVPEMTTDQVVTIHRTVRGAAKEYIDANLHNGPMDPATIAAAVNVSRSVLYRAFDSYGGVAAYVMTRRLDRCFEALVRRRGRSPAISEIAYANGFTSDAHFSRAFRARFGMSPREVEDLPGGPDGSSLSFEDTNAPVALDWMRFL